MTAILHQVRRRVEVGRPGTRARCPARSRRYGQAMFGRYARSCDLRSAPVTWRCSIWRSTASSVAAISSPCGWPNGYAIDRANIRQRKTGRPVRFELTQVTRQALDESLGASGHGPGEYLFAGRRGPDHSLTTRQYARLVAEWVSGIGLDPLKFATHSMRRSKATLIYRRTGNLRAVQLLLGHQKIESTVWYLGVEVDDALEIAEKIDV